MMITDTPVMAAVTLLAGCLCQQITEDESPEPCFCGVMAGADIPIDVGGCNGHGRCDNGMAFVRVISTYPCTEVGVADITPGNCAKGIGFDIEIGVFRCYPLEHDGSNPSAEKMLEAAQQQMKDEQSMRRALACCDWVDPDDTVAGLYVPEGPAGGTLGGIIPVSALIV